MTEQSHPYSSSHPPPYDVGVLGAEPLGEGVMEDAAELARRSPPEPALSKAEWAGMTMKEHRGDIK